MIKCIKCKAKPSHNFQDLDIGQIFSVDSTFMIKVEIVNGYNAIGIEDGSRRIILPQSEVRTWDGELTLIET